MSSPHNSQSEDEASQSNEELATAQAPAADDGSEYADALESLAEDEEMVDAEAAILPEGAVAPPDDRPAADYIPGVEYEIVDSDAENEPDELDLQVGQLIEVVGLGEGEELQLVPQENDSDDASLSDYDVDGSETVSSADEGEDRMPIAYDQSAPSSHAYLGEDMSDVHGRTIFDDEEIVTLPAYAQRGVILVPGQTMPLQVYRPQTVAMLRTVVEQNRTIAFLHTAQAIHDPQDGRPMSRVSSVGTTAEVFSISAESDDDAVGLPTVKALTRGRQRFKVLSLSQPGLGGIMTAKVKILPERELTPPLWEITPNIYKQSVAYNQHRKTKRRHNPYCMMTSWPSWVYQQYDPEDLMRRVKSEIISWGDDAFAASMTCPERLSYWVAANMTVSDKDRIILLAISSSIQRLRYELHLLRQAGLLCCESCHRPIAKKTDVFSLAYEGPMGTYVNPHGHTHQTLTVYKAKHLTLHGRPSTEYSWFPGYAWTIANCKFCGAHKGWKFTATESSLKPHTFFGLTRSGLVAGTDSENDDSVPVC